ncbi:MAG: C4-dicarboxylate ABC transporter substrate-binding protein [Rhodovulum sulfidophilum]|uniref:C4-dicarboxylate ABC transporter substrate-binding protein n=1 Tax=Rhodovulum sulfidophilum TaxID=35806 RepID=A0A2W5N153_RHOSU|nr:MAG: C4-dicarboxylate ABC transporter substrate-binding protein [Rhodovulum sulfidophilum]
MKTISVAALVAALAACCARAETYELTISSSHAATVPWVAPLSSVIVAKTNERLAAMGSGNRVDWTEAYAGSLYGFGDTLEAVGEGITDAGWVGTLWEESKLPYQNVTYYTPFTSDDAGLVIETFNRLHAELPFLSEAWEAHGVVFLGATGADTYHLFTTFPVNSVEDLRGRKILAPGTSAPWITAVGAVPVDGALTTFYNQIETGMADGVLSIMSGAAPLRMHEVAPFVTLVGVGSNMIGAFAVNKDTWDGLPEDVRQVLRELGPEYSAENARIVEERYQASIDAYRADPTVTLAEFPEAERAKWAAALPDLAGEWAAAFPRGAELIAAYTQAMRDGGARPLRDWTARP